MNVAPRKSMLLAPVRKPGICVVVGAESFCWAGLRDIVKFGIWPATVSGFG